MLLAAESQWDDIAGDQSVIHRHGGDALFGVGVVVDRDVVVTATVEPIDGVVLECIRDARVDAETIQGRLDAEDVLTHAGEGPGSGTGQPAVLALARGRRITSGHHLAVDIRLRAVDLRDVLEINRAGLLEDLKGTVSMTDHRFGCRNPRIVVTEDPGVLLISRRVGGDLTELHVIPCIGRLVQYDTVLALEALLHGRECRCGLAILDTDAGHDAHALWLDEDLALLTDVRAHRIRVCIEGTNEPLAVPAGGFDGLDHRSDFLIDGGSLLTKADMTADIRILLSVLHEHAGDEDRFRDRTLG